MGDQVKNLAPEVHAGLQLPREIVVEKSGEFREACLPQDAGNGNPEPSPAARVGDREGAETRASARTPDGSFHPGEAPDTLPPGNRGG